MFHFEKSIVIYKAPQNVFEFVANPANIPLWRSDVSSANFPSLPLKIGDTLEEVDSRDSTKAVVRVNYIVPEKQLVFEVISGGMYLPRRELIFSDEEGHTILTVKISAKSDGFSRWMEPTASRDYSLKWESYLFSLKRVLEGNVIEPIKTN